ncbi:MAG: GNAT family N-acetyltransferase [Deltaproteobacteria bacterium]|nr:GNAT family N-acetyltransferase [Deltaproteobacteria bacterium]
MIELVPIEKHMDIASIPEGTAKFNIELTIEYYERMGFIRPWISYLVNWQGKNVGICAFKGQPADDTAEIAYHTFPPYEGQGFATTACEQLIRIARGENAGISITARTLPEENASTKVLKKNGFECMGRVMDPDDGEVFGWILGNK